MKSIQLACIALVPALATATHAQTYKVMDYFNTKPSSPLAPGVIAQSRGGDLLATASDQSADLLGVAFRVTTSSALTVVHQFSQATGSLPAGGLTLGRDGQFYGTTIFEGYPTDGGSVFRMTPERFRHHSPSVRSRRRFPSLCPAGAEHVRRLLRNHLRRRGRSPCCRHRSRGRSTKSTAPVNHTLLPIPSPEPTGPTPALPSCPGRTISGSTEPRSMPAPTTSAPSSGSIRKVTPGSLATSTP